MLPEKWSMLGIKIEKNLLKEIKGKKPIGRKYCGLSVSFDNYVKHILDKYEVRNLLFIFISYLLLITLLLFHEENSKLLTSSDLNHYLFFFCLIFFFVIEYKTKQNKTR